MRQDADSWARSRFLALVRLARRHGVWEKDLLRGTGVTLEDLSRPGHSVDLARETAAVRNLVELRPSAIALGVEAGLDVPVRSGWDWRQVLMTSANFGEALSRAAEFSELTDSHVTMTATIDVERHMCVVTYETDEAFPAVRAFLVMRALTASLVIGRDILGEPVPLTRAEFAFDEPRRETGIRRIISVFPSWNRPSTRTEFELAVLSRALPSSDERELAESIARCQDLLHQHRSREGHAAKVCALLQRPDTTDLGLEQMADLMRLSPRTLRRRLEIEGTSYRQLHEEVKLERATHMLAERVPVAQIAQLLGYSGAPAFVNAFKRWTGTTPGAWQKAPHDG